LGPLGKVLSALIGLSGVLALAAAAAAASPAPGERDETLAWALLAGGMIRVAEQRASPRLATARLAAVKPAAAPAPIQASPSNAAAFIERLHGCAVAALSDRAIDGRRKKQALRRLLRRDFDLESIARFALGRHGRKASRRELREYLVLFEARLAERHFAGLRDHLQYRLEIVGARAAGKRDVVVASELLGPERPPRRVEWRVRKGRGGHKIVDVIVEGVSMAITQRAEVASVMRANGGEIEGLLRVLRARAAVD